MNKTFQKNFASIFGEFSSLYFLHKDIIPSNNWNFLMKWIVNCGLAFVNFFPFSYRIRGVGGHLKNATWDVKILNRKRLSFVWKTNTKPCLSKCILNL